MSGSLLIRPPPAASGYLETTPLVNLLLYAASRNLHGTLELRAPAPDSASGSIFFAGGQPAKVKTSEPGNYLGGILVELGYLENDQLSSSLGALASAKALGPALHGQILIEAGILDRPKLETGLAEQVARKLRVVSAMPPATSYEYFADYDGLRDWGADLPRGFDPMPMLWPMLLECPPRQMETALAGVAGSSLRLAPQAQLERLRLGREAQATAELLRSHLLRLDEIVTASGMPEREARLLVYLLLLTRQVDVRRASSATAYSAISDEAPTRPMARPGSTPSAGPAARSPGRMSTRPPGRPVYRAESPLAGRPLGQTGAPSARPPSSPADPSRPGTSAPPARAVSHERLSPTAAASQDRGGDAALGERATEILARVDALDRTDHFAMLGVLPGATSAEIEDAYFTLAKKWHPDALPKALAHLRPACGRVFARIGEAHAVLSDENRRAVYSRTLATGENVIDEQAVVERALDAVTYFQKAEIALKRNDLGEAEDLCVKALKSDPSQADYHALLAWLLALKPDHQSPAKTRESIRMLDRAVALNERCEKAYYWRGVLHKRLGEVHSSVRDFKRAADLNPDNIDALREVRLFNMRGGSSGENRKASGVHAATSDKRPGSVPLLDRLRSKK
jgi:curved DNA-binding protein CbpA